MTLFNYNIANNMIIENNSTQHPVSVLLAHAKILYYYSDEGNDPYHWNSGLLSPCYPDHRMILMQTEVRTKIIDYLVSLVNYLEIYCDFIASVESTGINFGVLLADKLQKPFCFVRKESKNYGRKKKVECINSNMVGKTCLIFDEVFSTGGHAIRSAEAIRKETGAYVEFVIGITNNCLPYTSQNFVNHGLHPHALTSLKAIAISSEKEGVISSQKAADISMFLKNPVEWAIHRKFIQKDKAQNYVDNLRIKL